LETSFPLLQDAVDSDSEDLGEDDSDLDADEAAVRATEGVRSFEDIFGAEEDSDEDEG
jgi:hypothetical protein